MKLSLYTLLAKDYTLEEAVKFAADAGFDAVDIRQAEDGAHLPNGAAPPEGNRCRQLVADYGLHISGLTTYYRIGCTDFAETSANLNGIESSMDLAIAMDAKYFRISGPTYDAETGYERQRQLTREQAVKISEMAKARNLIVTVEQHGGALTASAGQILDLFRGLINDNFGVVYDPGNCLREGYERPSVQIDMLRDAMKAVHVKNAMTQAETVVDEMLPVEQIRLDKGILNWPEIIAAIEATGYDGYYTLEDFSEFETVADKFKWNVGYLRRMAVSR